MFNYQNVLIIMRQLWYQHRLTRLDQLNESRLRVRYQISEIWYKIHLSPVSAGL